MSKPKIKYLEKILGVTFPDNTVITNATNSTSKVKKNSIFFGLRGTNVHGSKYIEEAFSLGASIAIHDDPNFKTNDTDIKRRTFYIDDIDKPWKETTKKEDCIILERSDHFESIYDKVYVYNKLLAFLCALNDQNAFIIKKGKNFLIPSFFGYTGTNGKTSSAYMAYQFQASICWESIIPSIYIGTLGSQYHYSHWGNEIEERETLTFDTSISKNTTPDIFEIFDILKNISDEMTKDGLVEWDEFQIGYIKINIELSSHALDQGRLKHIPFTNTALMNIGSDHIDYHKNIYEYEKSKLKIFKLVVEGVGQKFIGIDNINKDSKAFKEFFANNKVPKTVSFKDKSADIFCQIDKPVGINKENTFKITNKKNTEQYLYPMPRSVLEPDPNLRGKNCVTLCSSNPNQKVYVVEEKEKKLSTTYTNMLNEEPHGVYGIQVETDTSFIIKTTNPERDFVCKIFPEFNIQNLVFSILMSTQGQPAEFSIRNFHYFEESPGDAFFREYGDLCKSYNGVNYPIILNDRIKLPPGRSQIIPDIPANVIIDYAHNTEGFELFLGSIKNNFKKLVIVFGCGGDRDKDKRPKMLATAIKYGDKVIFTSDNPRSENFHDIFEIAAKGNNIEDVIVIEDRKEAILKGTHLIQKNDCLVILGKGHENTQEINEHILPFSDYEVVNEIYC